MCSSDLTHKHRSFGLKIWVLIRKIETLSSKNDFYIETFWCVLTKGGAGAFKTKSLDHICILKLCMCKVLIFKPTLAPVLIILRYWLCTLIWKLFRTLIWMKLVSTEIFHSVLSIGSGLDLFEVMCQKLLASKVGYTH